MIFSEFITILRTWLDEENEHSLIMFLNRRKKRRLLSHKKFIVSNNQRGNVTKSQFLFYFKGTFVLFISLPETCNMPLNCFFPRWWWLMTLISPTWQIIALCKSRWIATQLNFSSRYLFDWSSSSFPSLAAGKYWNMKSYWFFFH